MEYAMFLTAAKLFLGNTYIVTNILSQPPVKAFRRKPGQLPAIRLGQNNCRLALSSIKANTDWKKKYFGEGKPIT